MKVAPIGAFGAMAFTIGKYGVASLLPLAKLMATFYATCLVFIFVVLGTIARAHGFSIWKFIRYIKEELLIALGTSSSESVLPRMMAKLENLGVKKSTVGLVVPDRLFVQPGRHGDLPDDGCSVHRSGDATPRSDLIQQLYPAGSVAAHLQGSGRHHRQRLYRAGRDPLGGWPRSCRRSRAHPRYRSLHVRRRGRLPISSATASPQWSSASGARNPDVEQMRVAVSTRKPTWRQTRT